VAASQDGRAAVSISRRQRSDLIKRQSSIVAPGSGTVPVISIPLAFRRAAASALHAADLPISHSRRTTRLPGSDDYSLNGSSPETSATSHTIRTVIATAKRYSLAVMDSAVGARILGARETRVLGVREIMSRLRPHCGPRSKMARPPISARAYCLVRNPMTAIWWGEAGIPCSVSIGVSDCSSIPPDLSTDIWSALMGKPITSYRGSCPPEAPAALSTSKSPD
jgi:hypothetical protein